KIYLDYEKFKRENNLIDFDDMLTHALNILNKDEELLKLYRNQFKYIQVDEGQDTCKLQFEIIKKVAYPNNNLFVVADDDQCIYGFRGANPEELLKLEKEYPSLKKFYMDKNFRSTQNIVTFSNEFIKSNKERFEKNINTDNDSFKAPIIAKLENNFDQYSYILNDIKKNNLDINSTAILYRNNISSIGMINELKNNNIPFIIKDINFKFFNHWILTDLYKFINFSNDQSNLMLFYDIYYKTNAFISKKQMNFINKLNPNQNVFDRLLEHPDIREIDKRRIRVLKMDFNKLKKLNPYSAIDLIEHELGYKDFLKENANFIGANYSSLITILNNIKLISKDIKNFDELEEKINDLKNYSVKSSKNNEGITLTTVHSSKGLEFENVYIIDLINSEFPNESYIDESDTLSLEEERRLFYVAMTRAKKYLHLVTYRYSSYESVDESLFLKELRDIVKK
ncbi:MAG TPA: ATP-dependent helicase, partial [Tissierellaceae bacterium]